ncbi:hypothetical protein ACT80S_08770 [Ramlibacter sp. MAHUQ-53]|uniref:hypothetical protein n=1 Tax=unclassified Ramlibacter TaxID=2617605 RepID=UPI00362EAF43
MLHPIFSVLVRRPDLLVDHLAAYAALAREEAATTGGEVARRALAWAVAVMAFIAFLVLAGTAAMVGVMLDRFHWMLLLAPGTALALAAVAFVQARRKLPQAAFAELRAQLDADARALRTLGSSP